MKLASVSLGGMLPPRASRTVDILERAGVPLLFVLMIVFFSVDPASGSVFLSGANVKNILGNQAVTAIVALAMVVPLVGGYFDLSAKCDDGSSERRSGRDAGPARLAYLGRSSVRPRPWRINRRRQRISGRRG